jgi:hypothetical protein
MQLQNIAFVYPEDASGKRLLFLLVSSDHSATAKTGCIFKMRCPDLADIERPDYRDLNPFINTTDPYNIATISARKKIWE